MRLLAAWCCIEKHGLARSTGLQDWALPLVGWPSEPGLPLICLLVDARSEAVDWPVSRSRAMGVRRQLFG